MSAGQASPPRWVHVEPWVPREPVRALQHALYRLPRPIPGVDSTRLSPQSARTIKINRGQVSAPKIVKFRGLSGIALWPDRNVVITHNGDDNSWNALVLLATGNRPLRCGRTLEGESGSGAGDAPAFVRGVPAEAIAPLHSSVIQPGIVGIHPRRQPESDVHLDELSEVRVSLASPGRHARCRSR